MMQAGEERKERKKRKKKKKEKSAVWSRLSQATHCYSSFSCRRDWVVRGLSSVLPETAQW